MQWPGKKTKRALTGIDVGTRQFRAIQLETGPEGLRIAAALALPRGELSPLPTVTELRRLRHAMERAGFTGKKVVVAAPAEKLLSGFLELPPLDPKAAPQMVGIELARMHRCAPGTFELGHWELPSGAREAKTSRVMAVACRHEDADALLDRFEDAGFVVEAIDARACVLGRVAVLLNPVPDQATALLELGWRYASLILLHRQTVVYERNLADAHLQYLQGGLCERLHLEAEVADYLLMEAGLAAPPGAEGAAAPRQARAMLSAHVDAITTELAASFVYAAQHHGQPEVTSLLLCGTGAAMPGLQQRLQESLRLPTRRITPSDLARCTGPQCGVGESPAAMGAMGLALFDV